MTTLQLKIHYAKAHENLLENIENDATYCISKQKCIPTSNNLRSSNDKVPKKNYADSITVAIKRNDAES